MKQQELNMSQINHQLRRRQVEESLRAEFEPTLAERVDRYFEVSHQDIIAGHHFAKASTECLLLYRDSYFLSTVMVSQSVAEGIFRFVLDRNNMSADPKKPPEPEMAKLLTELDIISKQCAEAFVRIWKSFRNDVHHMNPKVANVPFTKLAKKNIEDLTTIEREIFAYHINDGKLSPVQPKYWDIQPDGTVPVFLRLSL